ncbi:11568_t:CDS:2 [Ambispora leptoticha]|uniref:11568_t:CDS:1 n=1 Tax=Ambispora leptoticha TaxID=144679 RepID=A0A9N9G7S4_9GLOM|nr:11568_t:CDS:2 [Ambispora leptoticha]
MSSETPIIAETASVCTAEKEVITSTTSLDQDYQSIYLNIKTPSPSPNHLYQEISSLFSTYSSTYSPIYPQLPGITTSPIYCNQEETNFEQTESKDILEQDFLSEQTNLIPLYKLDMQVLLAKDYKTIKEAIEEQENDRYNREWTSEKITILLYTTKFLSYPKQDEKLPEDLENLKGLEDLPTETEALQQALQTNTLKYNFVYIIDILIPYEEYI